MTTSINHSLLNNPYLLLTLAPLIWGGNSIASKLAVGEIAPLTLVFLRWLCAILILIPFALPHVKKDWDKIKPALGWLMLYGVVGFAFFNILFYVSAQYTSAINIALIQSAIPMLILFINLLFFKQLFGKGQMAGLILAFVGISLIVTRGKLSVLSHLNFNYGDLLMLLAAVCYSVYSIGLRYKPAISWISFIFVCACFALLAAIPFAVYEIINTPTVIVFSFKSFLLLFYVSVLASIISQIAYAKGVTLIGANRASFAINLVPIFGVLLALIILQETLEWFHLVGLILVLCGIFLSENQSIGNNKKSH